MCGNCDCCKTRGDTKKVIQYLNDKKSEKDKKITEKLKNNGIVQSYFCRPEKNKYTDDEILNKKIKDLYFGFHPVYESGGKSNKLVLFHPFFYASFNMKDGAIIEYGKFGPKEKDEKDGKENHYWGNDGVVILEKSLDYYKSEYENICGTLIGESNFKLGKWQLCLSDWGNSNRPTIEKFLSKVDPNKQKYTKSKHNVKKNNCFHFCLDVIKTWKLKPTKEDLRDYESIMGSYLDEYGSDSDYYDKFKNEFETLMNQFE